MKIPISKSPKTINTVALLSYTLLCLNMNAKHWKLNILYIDIVCIRAKVFCKQDENMRKSYVLYKLRSKAPVVFGKTTSNATGEYNSSQLFEFIMYKRASHSPFSGTMTAWLHGSMDLYSVSLRNRAKIKYTLILSHKCWKCYVLKCQIYQSTIYHPPIVIIHFLIHPKFHQKLRMHSTT